jgi:hypothetical protein
MIFKTSREGFKFLKQNPIGGRQPAEYAPIFAQTPTATSPGEQVVTKEYVDNMVAAGNYSLERESGYLILNVQGPICADEFGLYIYERTGATGTIKFVSMTGGHNALELELDNQNGSPWSIHQPCIWTNDPNIVNRCTATSTAFPIISWDWNEVKDGEFVTITGSTGGKGYGGGGRIGLPWAIDKNTPSGSYRQTGRKFLGNNYGCGRNWWIQVSIPMKNVNADTSKVGWFNNLPNNLSKASYVTKSKEVFVYKGGSLYSYMLVHPGGTALNKSTVPIDNSALIELCADEDGCEMFIVARQLNNFNNTNLASASYVKCYLQATTTQCISGYQDDTDWRLIDGDSINEALWGPWNSSRAILDYVVTAGRIAENDNKQGLHFYARDVPTTDYVSELIIKD